MEARIALKKERAANYISGNMSFITTFINAPACRRAQKYLNEYRARGYGNIYGGLMHEPLKGEGAGCTAFAKSFYEILGILSPEFKRDWITEVRVPEGTIGGPDIKGKVDFFALFKNLGNKYGRWAFAQEPHRLLKFWNPEKMYEWVNAVAQGQHFVFGGRFEPVSRGNALGLVLDRRLIQSPETAFFMSPLKKEEPTWLASKLLSPP
jgi:hypothetical protein